MFLLAFVACAPSALAQAGELTPSLSVQPDEAPVSEAPAHASESAQAQTAADDGEAKRRAGTHFARAVALYREEAFDAALVEFQRAYAAKPNPAVLYNIAQAELQLHDYVAARASFEQYLEQGGSSIDDERRAKVQAELEELQGRIGHLVVRSSLDGAEVLVDDRAVGRTPLASPLEVNVGRHRLELRAPDQRSVHRTIEIAGGDELTEVVEVPVAKPTVVKAKVIEAPTRHRSWLKPWRIAGALTTAVLLSAALTTGYLAKRAQDDLHAELHKRPGDASEIADARDRTTLMSHMSDGFSMATAAVGVSTFVLLLLRKHPDQHAPRLTLTRQSIAIEGHF